MLIKVDLQNQTKELENYTDSIAASIIEELLKQLTMDLLQSNGKWKIEQANGSD